MMYIMTDIHQAEGKEDKREEKEETPRQPEIVAEMRCTPKMQKYVFNHLPLDNDRLKELFKMIYPDADLDKLDAYHDEPIDNFINPKRI